jgi:hypothetical protein
MISTFGEKQPFSGAGNAAQTIAGNARETAVNYMRGTAVNVRETHPPHPYRRLAPHFGGCAYASWTTELRACHTSARAKAATGRNSCEASSTRPADLLECLDQLTRKYHIRGSILPSQRENEGIPALLCSRESTPEITTIASAAIQRGSLHP